MSNNQASAIITDVAELNKAIDSWGKRASRWVKDGQLLGLSALQRLKDHGDIGPANRLYMTMPKGTKSGSMAAWLLEFSALIANTGGDAKTKPFTYSRERAEKLGSPANMEGAARKPWQDCGKQEEGPATIDVLQAINALIKRLEGKELTHADKLEGLRALVATDSEPVGSDDGEDSTASADPLAV